VNPSAAAWGAAFEAAGTAGSTLDAEQGPGQVARGGAAAGLVPAATVDPLVQPGRLPLGVACSASSAGPVAPAGGTQDVQSLPACTQAQGEIVDGPADICLGETCEIPLTRGLVAIVDAADFGWLSQWKWHANRRTIPKPTFYAARSERRGGAKRLIYMHRVVAGTPDESMTDHANGNTLDNRRTNLRPCSQALNAVNSSRSAGATGFRGVWRQGKTYVAYLGAKPRRRVGRFASATEAAVAYDRAALAAYGEFAKLNFEVPPNGVEPRPLDPVSRQAKPERSERTTRSGGDSPAPPRKPMERAPGTCALCGGSLPPSRGTTPRTKCEPCRRFTLHLNAATKALAEIEEAGYVPGAAPRLRAALLALANRVPARWERPRGAGGRFTKA
jgi:hypothetical protein